MKRYLREIWSIWYWSLFRRDLLQQRFNELVPRTNEDGSKSDSRASDVLFSSTRFSTQYFLLISCLASPLIVKCAATWNAYDLLFLVAVFLCSYACSFISLPFGTFIPLLMVFLYLAQKPIIALVVEQSWSALPSASATSLGIAAVTASFWFARLAGEYLSEVAKTFSPGFRNKLVAALLSVLVVGAGCFIIGFVMWLVNFSRLTIVVSSLLYFMWLFTVLFVRLTEHTRGKGDLLWKFVSMFAALGMIVAALGSAGFVLTPLEHYGIRDVILLVAGTVGASLLSFFCLQVFLLQVLPPRPSQRPGWIILTLVLVGFTLGVGIIIALGTTCILAALITLPMLSFFSVSLLISAVVSPPHKKWQRFFFSAVILTPFGFLALGWVGLLTPLVSLLGYCRLIPDYVAFCLISVLGRSQLDDDTYLGSGRLLGWLPPNISSIVWFQIPAHDKVLAAAFNCNPEFAAKTLHAMQVSPFPSLRATANRALPQIVADRLKAMTTVNDLLSILSTSESPLRTLLPKYYSAPQRSVDQHAVLGNSIDSLAPEISIIFPELRTIVKDVNVALKNAPGSLRETALITCKDDLNTFDKQLSKRGYEGAAGEPWRMVSKKWRQILDDEIRSQQSQAFRDIRDPFQAGIPLQPDRPHLFKGRTNFVKEVQRQILESSHKTIVLHGPRQCGKTSFLNCLPNLLSSKVIPVSIDVQHGIFVNSDADLFFKISSLTEAQAIQKGLNISPTVRREEFIADTYPAFDAWLNRTSAAFGSYHVLICFDEFEELGTAYEDGRLTTRAFHELRHLIQHSSLISFLLAGMRTLEELGPHWSSHFINAYPIEMVYLESEEAKKLLIDPTPNFQLKYDEGIVERVLTLTRNHPLLIHLLGGLLVKQANEARTRVITNPLLNNAVDEVLAAAPYFHNIWNELTGRSREEVLFGRLILDAIARDFVIPRYGTSICEAALHRLRRFHVIERTSDGYRIEIPLFKKWVLTHGVIES